MWHRILTPTTLLLAAGAAQAGQPMFEAEQVNIDGDQILALGGSSSQRLAQTFRISRKGWLSHLTLAASCMPDAKVRVTVEQVDKFGRPGGVVLAEEWVPGTVFTSVPTPAYGFRIVEFGKPAWLAPGDYAFILTAKAGDCGVMAGPTGDSYPDGRGWFEALPNPPGWIELFDAEGVRDLPFQVFMRD